VIILKKNKKIDNNTIKKILGCDICGETVTIIRGRYLEDPPREVCPFCLQETIDQITDIISNYYGIAKNAT